MRNYSIYIEGYRITGNSAGASFVANVEAESFEEACNKHYGNDKLFNKERLTYWGCKLYETLEEAKEVFG